MTHDELEKKLEWKTTSCKPENFWTAKEQLHYGDRVVGEVFWTEAFGGGKSWWAGDDLVRNELYEKCLVMETNPYLKDSYSDIGQCKKDVKDSVLNSLKMEMLL